VYRCGEDIAHCLNTDRHFSFRSGLGWVPEGILDDMCRLSNNYFVTLDRVLVETVQRGHKICGAAKMLYTTH
jgi:hypothetical protein